jgi:hypothetical protein
MQQQCTAADNAAVSTKSCNRTCWQSWHSATDSAAVHWLHPRSSWWCVWYCCIVYHQGRLKQKVPLMLCPLWCGS